MRKILVSTMAIVGLLLGACSKDDSTPSSATELIGIWQLESTTVSGQTTPADACTKKRTLVISQNEAITHDFENERGQCHYHLIKNTYRVEGNLLIVKEDGDEQYSFEISGNRLSLTSEENGTSETSNFKKVTQAELDAVLATVPNNGGNNGGGNNNNGSGNASTIANLDGIWQLTSEETNNVYALLSDCQKKSVAVVRGNSITYYIFNQTTGACSYQQRTATYRVLGGMTIESEGERMFLGIQGDELTRTVINNTIPTITRAKRITPAQLATLLQ